MSVWCLRSRRVIFKQKAWKLTFSINRISLNLSTSHILYVIQSSLTHTVCFPLPQVMQNNHIASVTLYGAPRTASQARPESSSSSHWTSYQNHIPLWPFLNLVPLLTEPLTQSQILNQADVSQNYKGFLAQLKCYRTRTQNSQTDFPWWVLKLTLLIRHTQPAQPAPPRLSQEPGCSDMVAVQEHRCLKWDQWSGFLVVWEYQGGAANWHDEEICARVELNCFPFPSSCCICTGLQKTGLFQTVVWMAVRCNGSV